MARSKIWEHCVCRYDHKDMIECAERIVRDGLKAGEGV